MQRPCGTLLKSVEAFDSRGQGSVISHGRRNQVLAAARVLTAKVGAVGGNTAGDGLNNSWCKQLVVVQR